MIIQGTIYSKFDDKLDLRTNIMYASAGIHGSKAREMRSRWIYPIWGINQFTFPKYDGEEFTAYLYERKKKENGIKIIEAYKDAFMKEAHLYGAFVNTTLINPQGVMGVVGFPNPMETELPTLAALGERILIDGWQDGDEEKVKEYYQPQVFEALKDATKNANHEKWCRGAIESTDICLKRFWDRFGTLYISSPNGSAYANKPYTREFDMGNIGTLSYQSWRNVNRQKQKKEKEEINIIPNPIKYWDDWLIPLWAYFNR